MSHSLYKIREEYRNWVESVVEGEGEITPELMRQLQKIEGTFEEKAEAYAVVIKEQRLFREAIKAEKDALMERLARSQNLSDKLEQGLIAAMEEIRRDKFETSKCLIRFRNSKAVEIDDETLIPEEYIKVKTERLPMKKELGDALKSGIEISGCRLVDHRNLQVR